MCYIRIVKPFVWSADKNETLKETRNISFEEVVFQIERGGLLDILEHPNQQRCAGQGLFVVDIGGYAYLVPFVESDTEIFLKTVTPSRKATNTYLASRR